MKEFLGDEYYVDLFDDITTSEPITEAVDEVVFLDVRLLIPLLSVM